jgi:transcription-repair coupling factor (superfamily II helicase)
MEQELQAARAISLGPVSAPGEGQLAELFQPNPRFGGELKRFLKTLEEIQSARQARAVVVSRQASRIEELWQEWVPGLLAPEILKGNLENGWQMRVPGGEDLHLFTDGEIFGWERVQPRRRPWQTVAPPEDRYNDLEEDSWVVHVDHGIGRFRGLVRREISGGEGEYLEIEYAEEDLLYVPVHQADRVTHYVGADTSDPQVTRLGSSQWERIKSRVKEDVQEIAADLLKLYARREVVEGYAFAPDSTWQWELEASFPYIETEDQLRVLDEVKTDMEQPKPMDRLICGDVGYGKTEIAVRAAFKAVMDGKQVAVLVPTTVLAQQHHDTFLERMSAFPVDIRMLSRFRTPRQQKEILIGLARGAVDIVIGTHRLLSSDVFFHDLGLLIVDEEQRFGVAHKEQIKKMRADIDVLTLTATPIPRTLYMALTGVRDISRIDTPPEERLPVVTHVGPYETEIIRRAIWRELERGGQVFFVHNRVKTIQAMRKHISTLVPEARVQVAHGQMPENELSRRMREFTLGEVDVLLSTSIIESGLDIPNANTLIVDRADMFGLAQLYQLRGRVGRGAQQAYAYFFKDRRQAPTLEGRLRLETIAEHTRLGVGYSVAMRDLEIRGAGDILGTRQSGHIAAVGFHLYTRLLAEAVRRIKGTDDPKMKEIQRELRIQLEKPLVKIDLPLTAGIPAGYIPDQSVRLGLYRRMASLSTPGDVDTLEREFKDRFGTIPTQVQYLFIQLKIKVLAEQSGILAVSVENQKIVLIYPEESPLPQKWDLPPGTRIGMSTLYLPFGPGEDGWLTRLIETIQNVRAR